MPYTPGRFVWRELMTRDVPRPRSYYSELFGWTYSEVDGLEGKYTLVHQGGEMIAGLWTIPSGVDIQPAWVSYVSVEDVDAATARARRLGWKVSREPADIPGIGRFSVLIDFGGAWVQPFRSADGDPEPRMPPPNTFCWESLATPDVPRAVREYGTVIGWRTRPGPGGAVPLFAVDDTPQGTVADVQEAQGSQPRWVTYVLVSNVEETRDRAARLGGRIVAPRIEIPTVGTIAFITDPVGATLGLYQPEAKS